MNVRAAAFALFVSASSCAKAPPPVGPSPVRAEPVAAQSADAEDAKDAEREALRKWLELEGVYGDNYARRVLYTWTTAEQIDELRKTRRLLSRNATKSKDISFFDNQLKNSYDVVTRIVNQPGFDKRRFAWSNPWATSGGGPNEKYGDRLIRIVLKPKSVIVRWESGNSLGFVDLEGEPANGAELLQHPERLGAVFHVDNAASAPGELPFREYVLCNEKAIEEWSIGTPEIIERLRLDARMLRLLSRELSSAASARKVDGRTWAHEVAFTIWPLQAKRLEMGALYSASLAFPIDTYQLQAEGIDRLAAKLEQLPKDEAFAHAPVLPLDALIPTPPVPNPPPSHVPIKRPNCVQRGSLCIPIRK